MQMMTTGMMQYYGVTRVIRHTFHFRNYLWLQRMQQHRRVCKPRVFMDGIQPLDYMNYSTDTDAASLNNLCDLIADKLHRPM